MPSELVEEQLWPLEQHQNKRNHDQSDDEEEKEEEQQQQEQQQHHQEEKKLQQEQEQEQQQQQQLQLQHRSTQEEFVVEKTNDDVDCSTSRRRRRTSRRSSGINPCSLVGLPAELKTRITSFLSPKDAFTIVKTCKGIHDDLAISQLPMKISFKSWYGKTEQNDEENQEEEEEAYPDNNNEQNLNVVNDVTSSSNSTNMSNRRHHHQYHRRKDAPRRGPKIPYLSNRTHSVTLTGSWSHQGYGHWRGEFYVIAHKKKSCITNSRDFPNGDDQDNVTAIDDEKCCPAYCHWLPFDGGRVVWGSPLENSNLWSKLTLSFVPRNDEVYYLYIKPGPGGMMLGHSLHVSNLIAHVTFYDDFGYKLTKHYKTIVRHISKVEESGKYNRAAFYTRILEAVARSIRIQLAKSNALDPVLERFFQSTGTKRDTASLLVLEEIARFLSEHACINERRNYFRTNIEDDNNNNNNTNHDDEFHDSSNLLLTHSLHGDSIPDWVPYADSSPPFGGHGTTTSGGDSSSGIDVADDQHYHHHHHHTTTTQQQYHRQQQRNSQQLHEEKIVTKCLRGVQTRIGKFRRRIRRIRRFTSSWAFWRGGSHRRPSEFGSTQFTTAMETAMDSSVFSLAIGDGELEN